MAQQCNVCSKQELCSYEPLEELTKELLEFLLIKVNFSKNPLLCMECKKKIHNSFEYKGKCVLTDDLLFPYVNRANGIKIDLKICRLCLTEISCNPYKLTEDAFEKYGVDRFFFRNFIPEVKVDSTKSPIMCQVCLESLLRFSKFATEVCAEEQSTETADIRNIDGSTESDIVEKPRRSPRKPPSPSFSCESCTYKTVARRNILRHFESRHSTSKCPHCPWTGDGKFDLQMHVRKCHRVNKCRDCDMFFTSTSRLLCHLAETHNSGDKIFRCNKCEFVCAQRSSLNRHSLRHSEAAKRFSCDKCRFTTLFGHNLTKHKRVHRKPVKAPPPPRDGFRQCRICPFASANRSAFSEHLYVHKYFVATSGGFFKCAKCNFVHKHAAALRRHAFVHLKMRHKASSRIFDCDECDFVTIYKESWNRHTKLHSARMQRFYCDGCEYSSTYRGNLAKHVVKHRGTARGGERPKERVTGVGFALSGPNTPLLSLGI